MDAHRTVGVAVVTLPAIGGADEIRRPTRALPAAVEVQPAGLLAVVQVDVVVVHAVRGVSKQRAQLRRDRRQVDEVEVRAAPLEQRWRGPRLLHALVPRIGGRGGIPPIVSAPRAEALGVGVLRHALRQPLAAIRKLRRAEGVLDDDVLHSQAVSHTHPWKSRYGRDRSCTHSVDIEQVLLVVCQPRRRSVPDGQRRQRGRAETKDGRGRRAMGGVE